MTSRRRAQTPGMNIPLLMLGVFALLGFIVWAAIVVVVELAR